MRTNLHLIKKAAVCAAFSFAMCSIVLTQNGTAQKASPAKSKAVLPTVTQIDIAGLRKLIKPNGKPLLINFWATWCDPCREEFPDLIKLHSAYKDKVDFLTVSLDELSDIKTYVPKFLSEMNAEMPAYLLKTPDESAAIRMVSKEWAGNLPFTILIKATGETAYVRKGKLRYATTTAELNKLLSLPEIPAVVQ